MAEKKSKIPDGEEKEEKKFFGESKQDVGAAYKSLLCLCDNRWTVIAKATVSIGTIRMQAEGVGWLAKASGFIISPTIVVTTRQVIDQFLSNSPVDPLLVADWRGKFWWPRTFAVSGQDDLGLCVFDEPTFPSDIYLAVAESPPRITQTLHSVSYSPPSKDPGPPIAPLILPCTVFCESGMLLFAGSFNSGSSGGPIVDPSGIVHAVISEHKTHGHADETIRVLQNLPPTRTSSNVITMPFNTSVASGIYASRITLLVAKYSQDRGRQTGMDGISHLPPPAVVVDPAGEIARNCFKAIIGAPGTIDCAEVGCEEFLGF